MPKLVSVIILNWNGRKLMQDCLESLFANTDGVDYEVIVVDNGSTDDSVELLRRYEAARKIRLMENKENVGYSRGKNQGFAIARGEYVYMLDSDALVDPGWLEKVVEAADSDERIAAVGSYLYHPTEKAPADERVLDKMTVGGAGMLIKKKALDKIGYLDAGNFSPYYGEEIDWCYRARNRGYRIVQANGSRVRHWGSVSIKKRQGRQAQYELLFTHTYKAMIINLAFIDLLKHIPGYLLIYANAIRQGLLGLHVKAIRNNLRNWDELMKLRRQRRQPA